MDKTKAVTDMVDELAQSTEAVEKIIDVDKE